MTLRMIFDQMLDRSRSVWQMEENEDRETLKTALHDITLDVAMDLAFRTTQLVEQYAYAGPKRQLRSMRELLTVWRKLVRDIKAVNSDHPIHEHHLYLVLLDVWDTRLSSYEGLFDKSCLEMKIIYHDLYRKAYRGHDPDLRARRQNARNRILPVLTTRHNALTAES